jgi:hypothetical protein
VLVAERGPLVFVFNWNPKEDYEGLKVAAPEPGEARWLLYNINACYPRGDIICTGSTRAR